MIGRVTAAVSAPAALLGLAPRAAGQEPTWLREFGGSGDDAAYALLRLEPGRVAMAGGTYGALFGPSLGPQDAFLAWFDDAGNLVGGVQFGSGAGESAHALAPAPEAGVFVAGYTGGDFGAPQAGQGDAWVARRDASGGPIWVRQLGTPVFDVTRALCSDGAGGVFGAGQTFGGSLGGPSAGAYDVWIVRYDGQGTLVWLRQFGTSESDSPLSMAEDAEGGFYLCGLTNGSLGGPLAGQSDAWIGRFDADGKQVWLRQFGTGGSDVARAMSVGHAGGAWLAGHTDGVLAPGGGGARDVWIARYDASGNRLSILQFGSGVDDWPDAVSVDGTGGAFIAGSTNGSLGGPSAGFADAWVAHVQGSAIAWIDQFGSSTHDEARALAAGEPGTVFAAGFTYGTFAPGGGGFDDAWLARYDLCYADCNADGVLTVADFGCFQTRFVTSDLYTDCNADGALTVSDFGCFQTKFVVGCP